MTFSLNVRASILQNSYGSYNFARTTLIPYFSLTSNHRHNLYHHEHNKNPGTLKAQGFLGLLIFQYVRSPSNLEAIFINLAKLLDYVE
jgi:hypothetical protein